MNRVAVIPAVLTLLLLAACSGGSQSMPTQPAPSVSTSAAPAIETTNEPAPAASSAASVPVDSVGGELTLLEGDQVLTPAVPAVEQRGVSGWSALLLSSHSDAVEQYATQAQSSGWVLERKTTDGVLLTRGTQMLALSGSAGEEGVNIGIWLADTANATPVAQPSPNATLGELMDTTG